MAYLVDNELGRDVLVIPVFFTGSDATRENIALIASEFSKLRVEGQGGMRLLLQVLPEPRATGTYNTMDLSPGDWDRLGGLTLEHGEGVAGHLGHINTSRQNWIGATVRDILHFPGIPDGYTDLPVSKHGARRTEPLAGYDGSHNLSTVVINPRSRVAGPGGTASSLGFDAILVACVLSVAGAAGGNVPVTPNRCVAGLCLSLTQYKFKLRDIRYRESAEGRRLLLIFDRGLVVAITRLEGRPCKWVEGDLHVSVRDDALVTSGCLEVPGDATGANVGIAIAPLAQGRDFLKLEGVCLWLQEDSPTGNIGGRFAQLIGRGRCVQQEV
ncbi:hypothetical protein [Luteimonas sp. MC1572]|uniref:hypothetical protein n=1 Tax=Luteimonas sp. MC1572 TaxID=2799325 RepID=UPI001F36468D|nr:hypothetical protein [Luteimonas sp. MC1572]